MRVMAACSLGGAGHLQPLVPFLAAAQRRGDETLVVGPPALGDLVARTGHHFDFAPGGEPDEELIRPIRERLPVVPRPEATVLGNRELFGRLATSAMLPAMERIFREWRPDLVLRDPAEYASAVVAVGMSVRAAQVAISMAEAEAGSIAVAAPALEEHLAGLTEAVRATPYLTRFPASLDPSPFVRTVRFREGGVAMTRPSPWWRDSARPRIYLSFGTVLGHMSMAADVYRTALRAVESLDVDVLLTIGRRLDAASLGPVPGNVRVEAWVDQAEVMGGADLVVCHGGSGTTFGAVAAGVPVVQVPTFADQFENARRIAAAGAGVTASVDAAEITKAIETVLADPAYRTAAGRLATEMAAYPFVDEVLEELVA